MKTLTVFLRVAMLALFGSVFGGIPVGVAASRAPSPELVAAIKRLKIPGVIINLDERCVDIKGKICLDKGMLELVACTRGTKEHESIVAIEARSKHIHMALLLLGAEAGNPAMHRSPRGEDKRWLAIPPSGSGVGVFLLFPDKAGKLVEHPISEFITRSELWLRLEAPATKFRKQPIADSQRTRFSSPVHTSWTMVRGRGNT